MHVRTLNEGRPTSSRKRKEIKKVLSHLFGQLDVEVLDGGGEVGVLLGVGDHGALRKNQALFWIYITFLWEISKYLYDVPRALHVHPWLVHRQELHALQVSEAPEQNLRIIQTFHFPQKNQMKQTHLESVLCERWPDPYRNGEYPSAVGRPSSSSCGGALLRLWEGGKLLLAVSVG